MAKRLRHTFDNTTSTKPFLRAATERRSLHCAGREGRRHGRCECQGGSVCGAFSAMRSVDQGRRCSIKAPTTHTSPTPSGSRAGTAVGGPSRTSCRTAWRRTRCKSSPGTHLAAFHITWAHRRQLTRECFVLGQTVLYPRHTGCTWHPETVRRPVQSAEEAETDP